MIRNVQSLKSKVRNYAQMMNVSHQQIIQSYMFERFLERVSYSEFKNNFIIKGGCLLSSVMGLNVRSTMDIDTNIIGIHFQIDVINNIINSIMKIERDDGVSFQIKYIQEIKENKEYMGYRFKMIAVFENMKVPFDIDISTGDIITPKAIHYQYKKLLEDGYIDLMTYNYETIIAEKLQTVLELKLRNSRMKDYYDLYFFISFKWSEVNITNLIQAIEITFTNRRSMDDLSNALQLLYIFKEDETLNNLWEKYQMTHSYAMNISFSRIIDAVEKIVLTIYTNNKDIENT